MKDNIKKYLADLGTKGGNTTLDRHGEDHYKRISQMGVEAKKAKRKEREKIVRKQSICKHMSDDPDVEICTFCGFNIYLD